MNINNIRNDDEALLELITYIKEGHDVTEIDEKDLYYALVRYIFDGDDEEIMIDVYQLNTSLMKHIINDMLPSVFHEFSVGKWKVYTVDSVKTIYLSKGHYHSRVPIQIIQKQNSNIMTIEHVAARER